jgi:hypothetical protein
MRKLYTLIITAWLFNSALHAQSWNINGNANIASGTNYLGTKDPNDLVLRTNAIERGRLTADGKWHFGTTNNYIQIDSTGALNFNGKAMYKVAGNKYVFQFNGNKNIGLFYNSTARQYEFRDGNAKALLAINSDNGNSVFSGLLSPDSLGVRDIGSYYQEWKDFYFTGDIYKYGERFISNAGEGNSFLGQNAGSNNSARYVTGLGSYVLFNNEGDENTAIGHEAMYSNFTGDENTAMGNDALYSNTTGYFNTAVGDNSLYNNTKGGENTAVGLSTLINNTTGGGNAAFGTESLAGCTSGSSNVGVGTYAGESIKDGYGNTFVGYLSDCGTGGHLTNGIAIGNQATVTSNNHVVIGNSSITSIGGYVGWSNLSDGRVKKNIKQNVPGLSFINKLEPITYNLDLDAADKIINRPAVKDKDGKIIKSSGPDADARKAKEQIVYTGFIAQDVEKAAQSLQYDFSGVDKPDNANTLYGLRYSDFVVPLVKAVQELSKENDSLKKIVTSFQSQINELKQMIVSNQSIVNSRQSTVVSSASISQNSPNPFSNSTTISYSIPQQFSSAKIIITDINGNALKQINLSANKGSVNVDASTLINGSYQYSLYVDGKIIASKQMIIRK